MIESVGKGIFAFRNPEALRSNAGFMVGSESVIVFDSLMTTDLAAKLSEEISRTSASAVGAVVNTHFHGDHIFGNSIFAPPAAIIAHENTRKVLSAEGQDYVELFIDHYHRQRPEVADRIRQSVVKLPTCTFNDELALYADDDRKVQLVFIGPAHTDGDIVIYIPDSGVLFAGDVIFNRIHPYCLEATIDGSIAALERLSSLNVSRVVPGHGDIADASIIDVMLDYFRELREAIAQAIGDGKDVETTVKVVEATMDRGWPGKERLPSTIRRFYYELSQKMEEPRV